MNRRCNDICTYRQRSGAAGLVVLCHGTLHIGQRRVRGQRAHPGAARRTDPEPRLVCIARRHARRCGFGCLARRRGAGQGLPGPERLLPRRLLGTCALVLLDLLANARFGLHLHGQQSHPALIRTSAMRSRRFCSACFIRSVGEWRKRSSPPHTLVLELLTNTGGVLPSLAPDLQRQRRSVRLPRTFSLARWVSASSTFCFDRFSASLARTARQRCRTASSTYTRPAAHPSPPV